MESIMASAFGAASKGLPLLSDGGFDPLGNVDGPLLAWTALVFVLLLVILSRFAWPKLVETISAREDKIRNDIEQAEEARREAEEAREKHKSEMEAAAQSVRAVLDEARERAESLRTELERGARTEAEEILAKARVQIEAERDQALQDIRDQVVDLSVEITKRIVEKVVDREDHLRMAEDLIPKVREI